MHCLTVLNPTENKRQHAATLIIIVHYKTDQELRHKQQIKASSRQERRENCDYFQKKISMFFFDRLLSCYTLWQAKAVIVSHKMKLTLKSVNAETPCARCLISDGGVNHSSVQNGSCPQFPYWEIELETHVSNATCMSVKSPRSFLSSYFMLISCTFLRPITRNVKQIGWTEMLQEFRTSCVESGSALENARVSFYLARTAVLPCANKITYTSITYTPFLLLSMSHDWGNRKQKTQKRCMF